MPDAAPVVAGAAAGGQQQGGGIKNLLGGIIRMGIMYYVMQYMKGNKGAAPAGGPGSAVQGGKPAYGMTYPLHAKGDLLDFYCFISEKEHYGYQDIDMADLVWSETGMKLATPDDRNLTYIYEPSQAVQNNGSVYLHTILSAAGLPILPNDPGFDATRVHMYTKSLIQFLPRPKNSTGVNLLTDAPLEPQVKDKNITREVIAFFRPNITIQMVEHFQAYQQSGVPAPVMPYLKFKEDGNYQPVLWFNDFWTLRDKLIMMNSTVTNVTLHLHVGHASLWYWQLITQMEQSFSMQVNMGLQQDGESDELKRVLLEGNPYLLALTFCVSLLHTVFDMLAFKNDIGFWKNNKSMEGLSARSVLINAFCQVVILFYLFDNDTSFVVLFSSVLGTGIEIWKVTKAFDVSIDKTRFPFIILKDRSSYSQSETKAHDADAMRYLSYALYPLVLGYSVYTLMYKTHKSWYSWVLTTLVGAVYMFGFILMCPQLYLNYKLKSVAHLPWRQMTYKFLNTIIDDLFAFVIKMPLLHRLSVFRDDLVFLVFMYQRWIYRVDKTRVNEFGWSEEMVAKAALAAAGGDTTQAAGETLALTAGKAKAEGQATGETEEKASTDADAPAEGIVVQRKGKKGKKDAAAKETAVESEAGTSGSKKKDK